MKQYKVTEIHIIIEIKTTFKDDDITNNSPDIKVLQDTQIRKQISHIFNSGNTCYAGNAGNVDYYNYDNTANKLTDKKQLLNNPTKEIFLSTEN